MIKKQMFINILLLYEVSELGGRRSCPGRGVVGASFFITKSKTALRTSRVNS